MSLTTKLSLFAAFIFFMLIMAASYRKKKKRIIFFGDSLTAEGALYGGYIQRIATYMQDEGIAAKYDLVGMGKNGDKVADLFNRMSRDILERGADMVVIFIGINDVWQNNTEAKFAEVYKTILEKLKSAGIRLILCTLPVIGEKIFEKNEADNQLDQFTTTIQKFGMDFEIPVVNLREAFRNVLVQTNENDVAAGILTRDGVHLNEKGNNLVAEEIWMVMRNEIAFLK